jgi:hypothetical protein
MRAIVAFLLGVLAGCAPAGVSSWDAREPFSIEFVDYPFSQPEARRALTEGLGQFAAKVTPDGSQRITLRYDPECNVKINAAFAAAINPLHRQEIIVCPKFADALRQFRNDQAKTADVVLKHELGHVLGGVHIPTGMMQAVGDGTYRAFQPADIAAICSQHILNSPVCD